MIDASIDWQSRHGNGTVLAFSVSALMDDSSENISSAELAPLEKDRCDCQLTQGRSAQNLTVNKALSFKKSSRSLRNS